VQVDELTPEGQSVSFTPLPRVGYDVTTGIDANTTQHFIFSTSVGGSTPFQVC